MKRTGTAMNIHDIRNILAEQIQGLRAGETVPATANAITNAVGKILSSVKLEMEYSKLSGTQPNIGFLRLSAGSAGEPKGAEPEAKKKKR